MYYEIAQCSVVLGLRTLSVRCPETERETERETVLKEGFVMTGPAACSRSHSLTLVSALADFFTAVILID